MPVSDQHQEYTRNINKWELVRNCVEGANAIKNPQQFGCGATTTSTTYLPQPCPEDTSTENGLRYSDYVKRANFVNFTGTTKEGIVGLACNEAATVDLPPTIDYLENSTDGGSLTLEQLTKTLIGDMLEVGRAGLLTDYPQAASGLTQEQVTRLNLRASVLRYTAESIINWRTDKVGGIKILTLVVLCEPTEKLDDDGFGSTEVNYHRVLRLNEEGVYVQNLYNDDDELIAPEGTNGDIIPKKSDGSVWREIPFTFVGSENNEENVDKAALYDIAEVNVAHYRNSADFEESSYMVGQPTPFISGLTQSWVDANFPEGVLLGSRTSLLLPEGGQAGLVQANSNQMPFEGMKEKESQMVKMGARIISDGGGVETAEAARIRFAGQTSKLASIVGNVEDALIKSFGWVMEFMGGTGEVELELNRQFYRSDIDPQELIASIQMLDRQIIGKTDFRSRLRKAAMIERTDEEIDEENGTANPLV